MNISTLQWATGGELSRWDSFHRVSGPSSAPIKWEFSKIEARGSKWEMNWRRAGESACAQRRSFCVNKWVSRPPWAPSEKAIVISLSLSRRVSLGSEPEARTHCRTGTASRVTAPPGTKTNYWRRRLERANGNPDRDLKLADVSTVSPVETLPAESTRPREL